MSWSNRDRDCKNGNLLFRRRFRGRHRRGIFNSLLFYLFCFYFLFLYNLILLFLIGNTCTEMVILNKPVVVSAIIICWIHSSAFHWFMWDSSVCESFHFFISVHLMISALFEVNDFLSAEVFPAVMDVKIDPGFWTQKKTPFPLTALSRGHLSLQ